MNAVSSRTAPYGQLLGLAARHSHQGALWLVEAVVRSGATRLSLRRAVKTIFALKRVVEQWELWSIFAAMHIVAEYCRLTYRSKLECSAGQKPKVHSAHKCITAIPGLRCVRHAGVRMVRSFKSHAVNEICTVVFVWHAESVRLYAVSGLAVPTKSPP